MYISRKLEPHFFYPFILQMFGNGESLEIIRVTSNDTNGEIIHELELIEENLEKIMCHPDVKENPVQIVSIAGAFRKGKSFLLGFFLKYLQMDTQLQVTNYKLVKKYNVPKPREIF